MSLTEVGNAQPREPDDRDAAEHRRAVGPAELALLDSQSGPFAARLLTVRPVGRFSRVSEDVAQERRVSVKVRGAGDGQGQQAGSE